MAIEARQAVKADFSVPPTMPADTLDEVKSVPGVDVAEGSVSLRRHAARQEGRADRLQRPADAADLASPSEKIFQVLDYESGGRPADRRRGRDRPRDGEQVRLQGRRHGHRLRRRAGQAVQGLRHRHARPARTTSAARGWSCSRCPRRSRSPATTARTRSRSPPAAATPTTVKAAIQSRARQRLPGPDGRGGGRAAGAGPLGRARLPPHRAAGLRGRRAARRRLPDLQHVHGDRRAADEGVRAAARARRLARPGAALGADRDVRRRPGRVDHRRAVRPRASRRAWPRS